MSLIVTAIIESATDGWIISIACASDISDFFYIIDSIIEIPFQTETTASTK